MQLAEFDYELPEELIAQRPLEDRAASRMLVVYRGERRWEDRSFGELPRFLGPGDCLVLNDSRVFPSRLYGHRAGLDALPIGKNNPKRHEYLSGKVEVFLLRPVSADGRDWEALVRPGRKMRVGERIHFEGALEAEIIGRGEFGERTIRFHTDGDLYETFERIGHVPLPPYIKRPDEASDRERYQTVFARRERIGGRADRRPALHAADSGTVPRSRRGDRVRHAARRTGHVPAASRGAVRGAPPAQREFPDHGGKCGENAGGTPFDCGRDHQRAHPGKRRAAGADRSHERRDRSLHLSGFRIPRRRRPC